MAVDIKYYPEDIGKDYGSLAVKLPMNSGQATSRGGIFNVSYTTEEQAISNYINLLLTKKGERYMQPYFGIGIQLFIFEPNTEATRTNIEFEIRQQTNYWLPYIINRSITISQASNISSLGADIEHGINVVIVFSVTESGANRTMTVFQQNGVTNIGVV
jgi:phage baseplate assembly protein W